MQADNAARGVVLNDGSSANYTSNASGTPLPWLRPDNPVRIGSSATLHQPVILDFRNSLWEFQPTHQVIDDGSAVATFGDTRTPNLTPADVGGDLELGTFNVLNYFNTTGKDWIAAGHTCTFFNDRAGDPVTDNNCSDNGPRGAAESSGGTDLTDPKADVERQRAKEVEAINTMNADILSLEEIENSAALGIADRDDALKSLVDALNADAGFTRWAFAPSPSAADLPPLAQQDVIRTAFIYNPSKVSLVGASKVLSDESGDGQPFANAREPLAQEFKRKGALDSDGFLVVVNHFKSKGDSNPAATGDNANGIQGAFNGDRVRQAHAVVDFAKATAAADGTKKIFLVGDFNSYTQEDPMQVLYQNGFVNQPSDDPRDTSYEFDGMAGSLDHVLANTAGREHDQRARRVADQRRGVGGLRVQPLQQQRRAALPGQPVPGLRPQPRARGPRRAVHPAGVHGHGDGDARPDQEEDEHRSGRRHGHRRSGSHPDGDGEDPRERRPGRDTTLSGGHGSVVVGPFRDSGVQHVTVLYAGDDVTQGGHASVDITVTNGNPDHWSAGSSVECRGSTARRPVVVGRACRDHG